MKHNSVVDNKALVQQVVDEVWNQGNLAITSKLYHNHYAHYDPNFFQADDLEGLEQHVTQMRSVFAGLRMTVNDIVGEADKVGIRWTGQGTHEAEFLGVPATGQPVTLTGTALHRIAGGKIAQTWQVWNLFGILPQMGAMPVAGEEVFDWGEPLGAVSGDTGTLEENKGVVQMVLSKFYNGFNWERFDNVFHPQYRNHNPGNATGDYDAARRDAEAFEGAMPDLWVTIHDLVAEGDKVVKRWMGSYTSSGPYLGAPPTGRSGVVRGLNFYRIADGKAVEIWWSWDMLSLLQTIGLVPG